MSNDFLSIGLVVEEASQLADLAARAVAQGERRYATSGTYHRWSVGDGAELWVTTDRDGAILGVEPHVGTDHRVTLTLQSRITRRGMSVREGAFGAWAGPGGDASIDPAPAEDPRDEPVPAGSPRLQTMFGSEDGDLEGYPLLFDCPDADSYADLGTPGPAQVELIAFARSLDVRAPGELPADDTLNLAPRAFIPTGLFASGPDPEPEALALFTGDVTWLMECHNAVTGEPFSRFLVRTLTLEMEVVASPALGRVPALGDSVTVSAWLSGRMPERSRPAAAAPAPRSWKERLLRRP